MYLIRLSLAYRDTLITPNPPAKLPSQSSRNVPTTKSAPVVPTVQLPHRVTVYSTSPPSSNRSFHRIRRRRFSSPHFYLLSQAQNAQDAKAETTQPRSSNLHCGVVVKPRLVDADMVLSMLRIPDIIRDTGYRIQRTMPDAARAAIETHVLVEHVPATKPSQMGDGPSRPCRSCHAGQQSKKVGRWGGGGY